MSLQRYDYQSILKRTTIFGVIVDKSKFIVYSGCYLKTCFQQELLRVTISVMTMIYKPHAHVIKHNFTKHDPANKASMYPDFIHQDNMHHDKHLKLSSISEHKLIRAQHTQAGFTLIEIMVVIVILAILAGLVVPRVVGQSDKARVKTTETALSTVSTALDMYKLDNSHYPTTVQGLEALSTPPADAKNYPEGGYIKGGYPTDSWENELQYVAPGSEGRPYDLFSFGADAQQGGEGIDTDLYAKP